MFVSGVSGPRQDTADPGSDFRKFDKDVINSGDFLFPKQNPAFPKCQPSVPLQNSARYGSSQLGGLALVGVALYLEHSMGQIYKRVT